MSHRPSPKSLMQLAAQLRKIAARSTTKVGRHVAIMLAEKTEREAAQAEEGADRSGGDAMLSRACLSDNARFAHATGEQHLTQRVIDFV